MADKGSHGRWIGDVMLGGKTACASFEIFPSGGGWSLLFGKPLLEQFKAVHNYGDDTLLILLNGEWRTLTNKHGKTATEVELNPKGDSGNITWGDDEPPRGKSEYQTYSP